MARFPLAVLLVFAFASVCRGDDLEQLKNLRDEETRRAVRAFEKSIRDAEKAMEQKLIAAKAKFLADLAVAQRRATQANDLDSAILIRDARESIENDPAEPIQILAAFYGQNVSWLDVTDKVQAAAKGKAKWASTVATEDWGEPAPNFTGPRTLLIRYAVDGRERFKAVYEGQGITIP